MKRGQHEFAKTADYIIGVDESGTGAFAGPFTVCAFMTHRNDTPHLKGTGVTDSKAINHRRRVKLCADVAAFSIRSSIIEVSHDYKEQRVVWREAVAKAVVDCLDIFGVKIGLPMKWDAKNVKVVIDGAEDVVLRGYFNRQLDLNVNFVPRADATVPQVSAASVFAKTRRTEIMEALHAQYPMYGWSRGDGSGNAGYGTDDHLELIRQHGVCALHRRVRPLLPYFDGGTSGSQGSEAPTTARV